MLFHFYNVYWMEHRTMATHGETFPNCMIRCIQIGHWSRVLGWDGPSISRRTFFPEIGYGRSQQGYCSSTIDRTVANRFHVMPQPAAGEATRAIQLDAADLCRVNHVHSTDLRCFAPSMKSTWRGDPEMLLFGRFERGKRERFGNNPFMRQNSSWR